MKTADLVDDHATHLQLVDLPFRKFGKRKFVGGRIQTIKCYEDNVALRAMLQTPGEGRILVIDGGGSTRVAILGDIIAGLAIENGWQGLIINGAIRDSVEIDEMDISVFALGTSPIKSAKEGWGKSDCAVAFGGVTFEPNQYVYADADGVLHSVKNLT